MTDETDNRDDQMEIHIDEGREEEVVHLLEVVCAKNLCMS